MSNFDKRVQVNKIIDSQLPEFITADFPKATEFFKQYYISQEFQGGNIDIATNLDQYLKLDNLTPDVITGVTSTTSAITTSDDTINVSSTKGYPNEWGLLKIDSEIITYTAKTDTSFTGCVRGFSGITGYDSNIANSLTAVNKESLVFEDTAAASHDSGSSVINLSVLFLQKFYKKLKIALTPGLEDNTFATGLDVNNFLKSARAFYQAKGIAESIRILFKVLYGKDANVLDLEQYLIKPSSADFIRREVIVAEPLSGDPQNLVGQTVYKSTDLATNGSVSEVEIITRENKPYYKLSLFVGYNERDLIEGTFTVPGKTKVLEPVSIGSSVISVDSTIGFGEKGLVISGVNSINYTSKSVNQFFGVTGISSAISLGADLRSDEVIFGYDKGDLSKKVELRITGVIAEFVPIDDIALADEQEVITVKNIGEKIENPRENKTYKEIFANSWIYNTSTRYHIQAPITGSQTTFTLLSPIDKSSLKVGDTVDIVQRNQQDVRVSDAKISSIDLITNEITLTNLSWASGHPYISSYYDIRKKVNKAKSTINGVDLKDGNNTVISDILNVYTDEEKEGYVASNSLPSYEIDTEIIQSTIPSATANDTNTGDVQNQNEETKLYSVISFPTPHKFYDGDVVVYTADSPLSGLKNGDEYYVYSVANNKIKLYSSLGQLFSTTQHIEFDKGTGSHTFTLRRHKSQQLSPNEILRKFPLKQRLNVEHKNNQTYREVGVLINGVEITSLKSEDRIYYGPIEKFDILNGGKDYDIVNPPFISIAGPAIGTTAVIDPIISGNVKEVIVDPQGFDIEKVISVDITGGNGSGCLLQPIIGDRYREMEFDSRDLFFGGGVDITNETITFKTEHGLINGQPVIYNQNGNKPIGVGVAGNPNQTVTSYLGSGDTYYARVVNTRTISLYNSREDAVYPNEEYAIGINTIGLSTATSGATVSGIHKFRTLSRPTLRSIKVLNSGSGYEYRKLRVKASGISTHYDWISYKDHGFGEGDYISYSTSGIGTAEDPKPIVGLSTSDQYRVIKIDDDAFRLCNAGVGGTITTNYDRKQYVGLGFTNLGYHVFQYPEIKVNIKVSSGTTSNSGVGTFTLTPIVTGEITGGYLPEAGTGYGSKILNLQKKPLIALKNGKEAQLTPVISDGKIIDVQVLNKGYDYYSVPSIEVTGSGTGAILRPVIKNGKVDDVVIVNTGIGYSTKNTNAYVNPRGSGAILGTRIRDLQLNDVRRFGDHSLYDNGEKLAYSVYGYSEELGKTKLGQEQFSGTEHSPIIGWAYDGNPIYGPYGYTNPDDASSGISLMTPSYGLNSSNVVDRPSGFVDGYFVNDYEYNGSGTLDKHNGRYGKTPDFPNGVYAYFASVGTNLKSNYPYFIGDTYRNNLIEDNLVLDHSFDFNSSNLSRNTFPYKLGDPNAENDFILESNEVLDQQSVIESVTKGDIDSLEVLDGGTGYKIGDFTEFDNSGTNGTGLKAEVSELIGIGVSRIDTSQDRYENVVFTWEDTSTVVANVTPNHKINNQNTVLVSGLSTSVTYLPGSFAVGVTSSVVGLHKTMTALISNQDPTFEDIYVSEIPNTVSIGGSIQIGNEILKVLNIYPVGSIMRVKRYPHYQNNAGVAHTYGSNVSVITDTLSIKVQTKKFDSKIRKKVYFNAKQSVGTGTTTGSGISTTYTVGETTVQTGIPCRQLYIPNHPFKTGQKLTLRRSVDGYTNVPTQIQVQEGPTPTAQSPAYLIPDINTNQQTVYVINKGTDYIGITTGVVNNQSVGAASTSEGLYFTTNGSDHSDYLLEETDDIKQVFGNVDHLITTLTTKVAAGSTEVHGLQNGDEIKLVINPKTVVGLGTTTACTVHFNDEDKKLLINPIRINFSAIGTTDSFTFTNHRFNTGDKIWYETISGTTPTGLTSKSSYYIHRVSDNKFKLTPTWEDARLGENIISFTTVPSSVNSFSLINPPIQVVRNSNLTFGLSTTTLNGFDFKIFYDNEFKNEFSSVGTGITFTVAGVGTVGDGGDDTKVTINYHKDLPTKLYYALSKGGFISTADTDVVNHSEIRFVDSEYDGRYNVFGVDEKTFKFSPHTLPNVLTYTDDQCDKIEYSSKSKNITGKVKELKILSRGFNYKRVPRFLSINSTFGRNANIVAISTDIGRIKDVRIKDIGYEYPADKTLRPEAFVPPILRIDNLDVISSVDVTDGGKDYLSPPDLIVWNPVTNKPVDTSSLLAHVPNSTISQVEVLSPVQGLDSVNHKIIAINNSNGVGINTMYPGSTGIVTATLKTPINGFTTAPFSIGDQVFVEGIELYDGTTGEGYNSSDYNYQFFTVTDYIGSNPAVIEYSISGLTTNPGVAKTAQSGYANVINSRIYPTFRVNQNRGIFTQNEHLYVDTGSGYLKQDLYVSSAREDYIKVTGDYTKYLEVGHSIRGENSGVSANITDINENKAQYKIDYANRQNYGWLDNIGKLSEDIQVIPDNDYYQNLSYSVQSPITWDKFVDPVNRVVHPSGLKNFADTSVTTNVNVGVSYGATTNNVVILDVYNERRVDTINNYDEVLDYDTRANNTKSKYLQFKNSKLTDYNKCLTNRVLLHDDISGRFSSKGNQDLFTEIEEITDNFARYLIQVKDPDTLKSQITDLVVSTTTFDAVMFERSNLYTDESLGDFSAEVDSFQRKTLLFNPVERYERDHDIKILKTRFDTDLVGVGSHTFGSVNLFGSNVGVGTTTVGFTTATVNSYNHNDFNALFANIQLTDTVTFDVNYFDAFVDFDGSDTTTASYFFDNKTGVGATALGIVTAKYDSGTGLISLNVESDRVTPLKARANIIGLGTVTSGLSTYRFLTSAQPAGTERSSRLESINNTGITTVEVYRGSLQLDTSVRSFVRVSTGKISALHQVDFIQDQQDVHVVQGPIVSTGTTSGIGTFGGVGVGNTVYLNFYADPAFTTPIQVQAYNEVLYTENDFQNEPQPLQYGTVEQSLILSAYDGVNGNRANKVDFDITHKGVPIYSKTFNPADATSLDTSTGIITIPDHFFNTGELLTYTPGSTFVGVGSTAIGIGNTADYLGNVVNKLPPFVYPVVLDTNRFKLVTRREYVQTAGFKGGFYKLIGDPVTFTNTGQGNVHTFEMQKKDTKSVIALDGIVQQPITYTKINHTLDGAIGIGKTFVLSGISTVQPRDVLKIDHEYMKVIKVGFSTERDTGVIRTGWASTFPIVEVDRGALGTGVTAHANGANVKVNRGSFNIVGSKIWFLDPPKGNTRERRSQSNLPYARAEYNGRTFLRSNYDNNMLFDDISDDFTGIGKTYTLSVGGANTTGVEIGNGILFINGVFQTPITQNNAGNNYQLEDDAVAGISSAVFTGISSVDGSFIKSEFDINQNQLPRGGLIVSLGSTPGLGYAPLEGAKVYPKLDVNGGITEIVGVGTTGTSQGISTALYDNASGIIEVTTTNPHGLRGGQRVKLEGLNFECSYGTKTYPNHTRSLDIVGIISATTFTVNAGTSTVTHTYQGQVGAGTTEPYVMPYYSDLNFGSGYYGNVAIGVTDLVYEHKFVSASPNCVTGTGGPFTPTNAVYESHSGLLDLTIPNHGRTSGNIKLVANSLTFTCSRDEHSTLHTYPRSTDPAHNINLPITVLDTNTIQVGVGSGGGSGTGANISAVSGYNTHTYIASSSTLTNAISITGGANITPDSVSYNPETGILLVNKSGLSGLTIQTTKNIANTADGVVYDPVAGIATIKTSTSHGFSNGDKIKIEDGRIPFTCGLDGNESIHYYPRPTDPVSGKWLTATVVNTTKFSVDVGKSPHTTPHTFKTGTGTLTGAIRKSNSSVGIATDAFAFTCNQDNHSSIHKYPRTSDPAHNAVLPVGQVTANTSFEVFVGKAPTGTGGMLDFTITDGGKGFINPVINVPQPSYQNVAVNGTYRIGSGNTTDTGKNLLVNLGVDPAPLALVGDRFGDAASLIKDNAQLIGEVAVGRMLDEYPTFSVASGAAGYNNQDCIDDIKDVLESINWNLQYGGNDRTVDTANLYVTDDHLLGEEQESIYAFKQTARLAVDVMRNKPITLGAQHKHKFVSATSTAVNPSTGSAFQPTGATYNAVTGELVVEKASHGLTPPTAHTAATGTAYNPSTGVLTVVTTAAHGFSNGDKIQVKDESITFTCAKDNHATQHSYPRATDPYSKKWLTVTVTNATTFTVNVGVSPNTSAHTFKYADSNGILKQTSTVTIAQDSLTFTCDLDDNIAQKTYPRSTDPAHNTALGISTTSSTTFTVNVGASQTTYVTTTGLGQRYDGSITVDGGSYTPSDVDYEPSTGLLTVTINNHGFSNGDRIKIVDNSIIFTCDMDNNATQHTYPRTSDPVSNSYVSIANTTTNTFTVDVGKSPTKKYTPSAVNYNPTTGIMQMTIGAHCYERSSTLNPTFAAYNPLTGKFTITVANHGLCNGHRIKIADNAFKFNCKYDQNATDHQYPRSTDPISGKWIPVSDVTTNTFEVQVLDIIPSTNISDHTFVSCVTNSITKQGSLVRIAPHSLNFTCAQDSNQTVHSYPRTTDPVYNESVEVVDVSAVSISVQVLSSQPSTNTSAHTFVGADIDSVSIGHYDHTFVSAAVGAIERQSPAACANVASAIHTLVGIVTTGIGHTILPTRTPSNPSLWEIRNFEVARDGHSFTIGDKFSPVGLVTAKGLSQPRKKFELEVVSTFNDYFSAWQFGQIDFIDSIGSLQNGVRRRFPLFYNNQLVSFEIDQANPLSSQIDLNSVLMIFVNGVLQTPGTAYQFEGGATFTFLEAPTANDKVDVFFYVGQIGIDTEFIDIYETFKVGDDLKVYKNPRDPKTLDQLKERIIMELSGSDYLETDTYVGVGITEDSYKPVEWTRQKADKFIKGDIVSKGRPTTKAMVFPTANIIQDISHDSESIFVDDAQQFYFEFNKYGKSNNNDVGVSIIPGSDPVGASFTAIVSAAGTISSFDITNVGAGYSVATIPVSVAKPKLLGVGIGTTATGTATITNGKVSSVIVTNGGLGYGGTSIAPNVIAPTPNYNVGIITEIKNVQGWSGIVTGITTTTGTGAHPLAMKFFVRMDVLDPSTLVNLAQSEPVSIVINETRVGTGVTSVDSHDTSVVAIGTAAVDNVYRIHSISNIGRRVEFTSNIHSNSAVVGIATTAPNIDNAGIATTPVGRFSWGRIYNYSIKSPIAIGVTGLHYAQVAGIHTSDLVGLSTYPVLQRRDYGMRDTGALLGDSDLNVT